MEVVHGRDSRENTNKFYNIIHLGSSLVSWKLATEGSTERIPITSTTSFTLCLIWYHGGWPLKGLQREYKEILHHSPWVLPGILEVGHSRVYGENTNKFYNIIHFVSYLVSWRLAIEGSTENTNKFYHFIHLVSYLLSWKLALEGSTERIPINSTTSFTLGLPRYPGSWPRKGLQREYQ